MVDLLLLEGAPTILLAVSARSYWLLTCRTGTIGTPRHISLGIFLLQLFGIASVAESADSPRSFSSPESLL